MHCALACNSAPIAALVAKTKFIDVAIVEIPVSKNSLIAAIAADSISDTSTELFTTVKSPMPFAAAVSPGRTTIEANPSAPTMPSGISLIWAVLTPYL